MKNKWILYKFYSGGQVQGSIILCVFTRERQIIFRQIKSATATCPLIEIMVDRRSFKFLHDEPADQILLTHDKGGRVRVD